ncbi:MAG: 4-phosphoerythronate dehydrogenase [Muribaculaceae bacterium]|nr:4-phosphoerythronate dehydrogenase [Muribaculaceae bacterium]
MKQHPLLIADENIPRLRGRLENAADMRYLPQEEITPEAVREADAIIVRTRTECNELLLKDSSVRLVVTATIGTDHIDIPWCESRGIEVANAPGCNAPGVAQYVWSSLLRLGFTPGRHKLGIIGCGNVGGIVAQWGEALGTEMAVSDPPLSRRNGGAIDFSARGLHVSTAQIRETSLDDILRECDAITLHTPLTSNGESATYHLIGPRELSLMKPGAILVNAARGAVVDNEALRMKLKEGNIRAVLDTWEGEPALDRELLEMTDIATPHIAGYSRQGKERATRMALEAVAGKFGLMADTSGLEGTYSAPVQLTPERITSSYDPFEDTTALKRDPEGFERLRHDYRYREETN